MKTWRIKVYSGRRRFILAGMLLMVVVASFGLTTKMVSAQQPGGELRLSNSGLPINLVANPGSTVTTDIRIRNEGTQPETLKTELMKFGAAGEEGRPELKDRESGDEYFDWVTLSPSEFTILPNEFKTVRMTVEVPESAAFAYYYAVTFSRVADEKPAKGQAVKGALATLVLLEAKVPNAQRELQVVEFTSDRKLYEFLPATFRVKIKNTGNVHAVPHGDITINQGSNELARMSLNPQQGYILPQSNRVFTVSWNDGFPRSIPTTKNGKVLIDDKGQPQTHMEVDWNKVSQFRIGEYTANMLLIYDDGKRDVPIESAVSFHILPWKLLLVAFVIAALVLVGILTDIVKFEHFLLRNRKSKNTSTKKSVKKTANKRVATKRQTPRKQK